MPRSQAMQGHDGLKSRSIPSRSVQHAKLSAVREFNEVFAEGTYGVRPSISSHASLAT